MAKAAFAVENFALCCIVYETYEILSVFHFLLGAIWWTWIDTNWERGHLRIDPACVGVEWHLWDAPARRLDARCGHAKTDSQYNSFPSHYLQIIIRQIVDLPLLATFRAANSFPYWGVGNTCFFVVVVCITAVTGLFEFSLNKCSAHQEVFGNMKRGKRKSEGVKKLNNTIKQVKGVLFFRTG